MYDDALLLLSSSVHVLQCMIIICVTEANYLDMRFNVSHSMVLRTGECQCYS